MTPRGRCVMAGAPKELWAVITRVLKALAWSAFVRQKFTFFIARLKKDDLEALCELMKTGKVTPVIDKRYQLVAPLKPSLMSNKGMPAPR